MVWWQKLIPVLIVIALIGIGSGGYFYLKYQNSQKELQLAKTDPSTLQKAAQDEVKRLVAEVSKIIQLPNGEDPTVATITDIGKLKDQPFFQNAKNGDKVLIYTNAKKAILYDPNAHKVIDVAPVNIGSSSAQQAQARILIRNGTATVGLASKVETQIKTDFPQANIVAKDNSSKTDYEKTLVVNLTDGAKDAAASLAKALNATVVDSLPVGETKPSNADIVVLVGKDQLSASPAASNKP